MSPKFIGLLMVADEDDIIDRTLEHNAQYVDCFYVLDGSEDVYSLLIESHPKCVGYVRDTDTGYEGVPRDGWRQALLEDAYFDHGHDNWFVLLHGDEWWTFDPRDVVHDGIDAYMFRLPFFFPRKGEPWQEDVHPIDQLHWSLGPGWPEYRLFRGGPNVRYDVEQHFNVLPEGLTRAQALPNEILHYPYRSPEVQRARAARHETTQFDPDNYRHITDRDAVYWTDEMIDEYRARPSFADLRHHVHA